MTWDKRKGRQIALPPLKVLLPISLTLDGELDADHAAFL
jgi:hypothetical protein